MDRDEQSRMLDCNPVSVFSSADTDPNRSSNTEFDPEEDPSSGTSSPELQLSVILCPSLAATIVYALLFSPSLVIRGKRHGFLEGSKLTWGFIEGGLKEHQGIPRSHCRNCRWTDGGSVAVVRYKGYAGAEGLLTMI